MARTRGRGAELERMRLAEEKAAAKQAAVRRKSIFIMLGVVAIIAAVTIWIVAQPPPPGLAFPDQGNLHLTALEEAHAPYNSAPPSSGPHFGALAPWGVSEEPIPPELYVHNLEDAGIVLAHDCPTGCDDIVGGMADLVEDLEGERLLVTPYEGIVDPDGVPRLGAAVAWARILYFDDWSEDTQAEVRRFVQLFEGIDHHVGS